MQFGQHVVYIYCMSPILLFATNLLITEGSITMKIMCIIRIYLWYNNELHKHSEHKCNAELNKRILRSIMLIMADTALFLPHIIASLISK